MSETHDKESLSNMNNEGSKLEEASNSNMLSSNPGFGAKIANDDNSALGGASSMTITGDKNPAQTAEARKIGSFP